MPGFLVIKFSFLYLQRKEKKKEKKNYELP